MSRESAHKVCAWLDKFDEDVKLEDSDDSDTDQNFVPDNVSDLRYNNSENESENDDDFDDYNNNTSTTSAHEFYLGRDEKQNGIKTFLLIKPNNVLRTFILSAPVS
ncbi:Hypothetical protein CINCED_3A010815 [Cinara cedri]|uniref:Uncharacterized protein n=1 Tax=Cinara cedri TaxID=506608 RepID=A0A5E4MPQ8_9HEMI|nr:Hypothetical protein CINCED_3A010815 [Cinara cedri]